MDEEGSEHVEELGLEPVAVVRKRQPRALWAALAAVAVAGGALVVTSADDDGNQRPGLPVDLAGANGAGAARAEAAADSMLAWVTYVPGDDLPSLGGEATAYRVSGEVDQAQVRALADALGLEADVVPGEGGSWSAAGQGDEGRLDVYSEGGGYWSYYAGSGCTTDADGSVLCQRCFAAESGHQVCEAQGSSGSTKGSATARPMCESEADCVEPTTTTAVAGCGSNAAPPDCIDPAEPIPCADGDDCIEPAQPAPDLPSEEDARQIALGVVAASGADVDGARVTADQGHVWHVTVEPVLDGIASSRIAFVEVGSGGSVVSGNGSMGQPEALGSYPLLDTRAVIERANAQSVAPGAIEPAVDRAAAASATTGTIQTGGTDVGGTTGDPDAPVTTVVGSTDPCAAPDSASDGCGGTTGCGGEGCVTPDTTIPPCKVQPDGREICEYAECDTTTTIVIQPGEPAVEIQPCEVPSCPRDVAVSDEAVGAPEAADCTPPIDPAVDPVPEPQPVEIVLVDAEPSLSLLPANDGSGDAYLVPAYRFTAEDGGTVDLPAVADEALTSSVTTETTVPDTVVPEPEPQPEPQPCEVLEEADASGTTHTVQTCPTLNEDALEIGGEGYYVDVDVECAGGSFALGGRIWITDDEDVAGWADPGERHEGGTFTLDAEDHGSFVGDASGTLVAEFRTLGPVEDIFCQPEPRR